MQGMRGNCAITTCWLSDTLARNVVHWLLNVAWKARKLWGVWKGDPNTLGVVSNLSGIFWFFESSSSA